MPARRTRRGRKDGSIQPSGLDSFRLVLSLGKDDFGRRLRHSETFRGTLEQARERMAQLQVKRQRGELGAVDRAETVSGALAAYLAGEAKRKLRANTYRRFAGIAEHVKRSPLGAVRLAALKPLHIDRYLNDALEGGRSPRSKHTDSKQPAASDKRGPGLAPATVRQHLHVIRAALDYAVLNHNLAYNPARSVKPPARKRFTPATPEPAAVTSIMEAVRGHPLEVVVTLAVATGARRGEIAALQWSDLKLAADGKGQVHFHGTLDWSPDASGKLRPVVTPPKSVAGDAWLNLPPYAVEVLKRERKRQSEQMKVMRSDWTKRNAVCCEGDGEYLRPDLISSRWRSFLKSKGLPLCRFHDLRHFVGTELDHQGLSPVEIARQLRHANPAFTAATYTHARESGKERAAEILDLALRPASGTKEGSGR